jgi:hypothetical protein
MRHLSFCLLLAAAATPLAAQTPSPKGGDKIIPEPIMLHACVTPGTEKKTYLLTNVIRADQPVGTSGSNRSSGSNDFYWLDNGGKLKDHVGYMVRVSGMLDDDVDKTETRRTKDGTVEVVTERTKKVEVPAGTIAAAAAGPEGLKRLSYKVKVRSVERLPGGCSPQ